MGSLVALYEIDNDLLLDLKKRRLLRRLVDVVAGYKTPDTIDLPADYVFRSCGMDKSWEDIFYLLHGLMPINDYHFDKFYRYYSTDISHKHLHGWYYTAEQVLWVLMTHRRLVEEIAKESGFDQPLPVHRVEYAYLSRGNQEWVKSSIVRLEAVRQTTKVVHDWAQLGAEKRRAAGKAITDYNFDPFYPDGVDYVMGYYGALIQFMTESVYRVENETVIALHRGLVGYQT